MNAVCVREYGESRCDATRRGRLMWSFLGGKRYSRGWKKISPMEILRVTWFDIRVYKIVCPANGNVLNKRFWPWVRICFLPCCWFHVHTSECTHRSTCSPSAHWIRHWLGLTTRFGASFSFSWGPKASKVNIRPKVAHFTPDFSESRKYLPPVEN